MRAPSAIVFAAAFFLVVLPWAPSATGDHALHAPIRITSDADFLLPPEISGVIAGNGTPESPFLIANWIIPVPPFGRGGTGVSPDGSESQLAAVTIHNTRSHVVVRDILVSPGLPAVGGKSIDLAHTENVTVESIDMPPHFVGGGCQVTIVRSVNVKLIHLDFENRGQCGLNLYETYDVEIGRIRVEDTGVGVYLLGFNKGLRVHDSEFVLNGNALRFARGSSSYSPGPDNVWVENNTFRSNGHGRPDRCTLLANGAIMWDAFIVPGFVVRNNVFEGNMPWSMCQRDAAQAQGEVDARYNWFGTPEGPVVTTEASNIQSRDWVRGPFLVSPWLTSPP